MSIAENGVGEEIREKDQHGDPQDLAVIKEQTFESLQILRNLLSLLTTLKGLPLTYNRDMQEDKEPVFDSVDTIKAALEVNAAMLDELKLNASRAAEAVSDPMLLATDLADYLVRAGVPFRQAHEVIGKLVAHCIETGRGFPQLDLATFQSFSPSFEANVFDVLDLRRALDARQAPGAPSQSNVRAQLERWRGLLA